MAEKRSSKKRRKGGDNDEALVATKDEKKVAQYLRFNLETKKATLYGNEAFYFPGSKAVDLLLDSKWAKGEKSSVVITHRDSAVSFLNRLSACGMFSHVEVIRKEKKVKDKKKDTEKKKDVKTKAEDKEDQEEKKGSPKSKKDRDVKDVKKVKKKVKTILEYHDIQSVYDDDDEFYVWTYDPLSWTTLFLGILLVIGVILVCLFPLWPESIREYSWYLSVAGLFFIGAILALAVLRYIVYGIVWAATMGKLHFWLLPNLTAECGFFESFVPGYEYEYFGNDTKEKSKKSKRKTSKEKKEKSENEEVLNEEANDDKIKTDDKILKDQKDDIKTVDEDNDEDKEINENDNLDKNIVDSEESSGSNKEEGWIKVKKNDISEDLQTEEKC